MKRILLVLALLAPLSALAGAYEDMEAAMARRDAPAVIALLGRGMDLNTVDRGGETLLMQAIRLDMQELTDYLLEHRARLNNRNRNGETAVSIAAFNGKARYVERLVDAGAELNFYGWPPLVYAAFNGHAEIVAYLLKRGADIDARSEGGATALYVAARNGHLEVVKLLLERKASPLIASLHGETPADAAKRSGHAEIERLVRDAQTRAEEEEARLQAALEAERARAEAEAAAAAAADDDDDDGE